MRMLSGAALRSLVRNGANLELDARDVDVNLAYELLELGGPGTFTFVAADHYPPEALERLAFLGHSRVTFRFDSCGSHESESESDRGATKAKRDGFRPETSRRLSRPAPAA